MLGKARAPSIGAADGVGGGHTFWKALAAVKVGALVTVTTLSRMFRTSDKYTMSVMVPAELCHPRLESHVYASATVG